MTVPADDPRDALACEDRRRTCECGHRYRVHGGDGEKCLACSILEHLPGWRFLPAQAAEQDAPEPLTALREALEDCHRRAEAFQPGGRGQMFPGAYALDHHPGGNVEGCTYCAALAAPPAAPTSGQFVGQMDWPCLCGHPKGDHYFGDRLGSDGRAHTWCQREPSDCLDFRPAPTSEQDRLAEIGAAVERLEAHGDIVDLTFDPSVQLCWDVSVHEGTGRGRDLPEAIRGAFAAVDAALADRGQEEPQGG